MASQMQDQIEGAQIQFEKLQDQIIDLVADLTQQNCGASIAVMCGLLIAVAESAAENSGNNPKAVIELDGAPRKITIHAA